MERFPDDFKLAFHSGPEEGIGGVVGKSFSVCKLCKQVARLSDVEQVLANLKRQHRAEPGSCRLPAENKGCESGRARLTQPAGQKAAPGLLAVQSSCPHVERA